MNAKLAGYVTFSQSIKASIDSLGKQGHVFALWAHRRGFVGLEGMSGRQPGRLAQWFQSKINKTSSCSREGSPELGKHHLNIYTCTFGLK